MEKDTTKYSSTGSEQPSDSMQDEVVSPHTHSRQIQLEADVNTSPKSGEEDIRHGFVNPDRDTPVIREHFARRGLIWRMQ